MPCRDGRDDSWPDNSFAEEQAKLDKVTRIACTAMGFIEEENLLGKLVWDEGKEAADWWKEHKEKDAARLKLESKQRFLKAVQDASRKLEAAISLGSGIEEARKKLNKILDAPSK